VRSDDSGPVPVTSDCILTTWPRQPSGYGTGYPIQGAEKWSAHRWAWTQARGPIPVGLFVLHRCDNPPCVRVTPLRPDGTPDPDDHLFIGTARDNHADMAAKGREARGERNGRARLSEADVRSIRAALRSGGAQRALARSFGVATSTIHDIATGRRWTHVR
jgi:hypothetical protein